MIDRIRRNARPVPVSTLNGLAIERAFRAARRALQADWDALAAVRRSAATFSGPFKVGDSVYRAQLSEDGEVNYREAVAVRVTPRGAWFECGFGIEKWIAHPSGGDSFLAGSPNVAWRAGWHSRVWSPCQNSAYNHALERTVRYAYLLQTRHVEARKNLNRHVLGVET